MQQYFAIDDKLNLRDSDYHHIKNVMRMKKGDCVKIAFNDIVRLCKIKTLKEKIEFEIIEDVNTEEKDYQIGVCFALIKEQKMDFLLQKTTELGVDFLYPTNMIRSVVKIDNKKQDLKIKRWNTIIKEASEQSYRKNIPKLNNILNIKDLINLDYDLKLICTLNKNTKNIKKVLEKNNKCVKILLAIGPEGGFDPKEEEFLIKNGFISVSLGNTVLRAETAATSALAMINYEFMR